MSQPARFLSQAHVHADGYSGNSLVAHFGLDDATTAETVRIEWPSGIAQELHNVTVNQILT